MTTRTELYRFSEQGVLAPWLFTSGNEVVTYAGEDYLPAPLNRGEIANRNEMARSNLEIVTASTNAAALRWLARGGEARVTLTIFQREKNGTVAVAWKGRLAAVVPGENSFTLKMESIFTSLRRTGLRARYQRSCRHALYGRGCNLDAENFAVAATCTAVSGLLVTITEAALQPSGYYTGGMLRAPNGALTYVKRHVGQVLTLQRRFASLEEEIANLPLAVTIYPGCAHNRADCEAKFNNLLNYGGFDFIPQKNPMGGNSIV